MNRKYYSAFAVSAVAMGAVAFIATEASATMNDPQPRPSAASEWPDEGSGFPLAGNPSAAPGYPGSQNTTSEYPYPNYDPKYEVVRTEATPIKATAQSSSDGNGFQFVQSGASAAAGAAVAVSTIWMYRRRQTPTA
jgi:hypothetical protein